MDSPPLPVVLELDRIPRANRGIGCQLDEPVFAVPNVSPAPVVGQVAVAVIGELLRVLRHINVAGDTLVWLVAATVTDCQTEVEPLLTAQLRRGSTRPCGTRLAVNRHCVGREAQPHDVYRGGHGAVSVLIEIVSGVVCRTLVGTILIAAGFGLSAVADVSKV